MTNRRSTLPVWPVFLSLLAGVVLAPPVWARVGITSVVDGQPVGKPPESPERVLHIGNDMAADEVVTTKAAATREMTWPRVSSSAAKTLPYEPLPIKSVKRYRPSMVVPRKLSALSMPRNRLVQK